MRADTVCGLPVHHIAWASIAMLLTGCASPYVATDRSIARQQLKPEVLGEAIAHARSRSLVYRDKVVELGESERLLSNGLLTFGAVILGASVAKVHSSALTGAGLLAGSAYTIGTFNTDKRRGAIYLAGIKAIDCSIAAVMPLALSGSAATELETQKTAVDAGLSKVATAIGTVDEWKVKAKARGNTALFQAAVENAESGLTAASAVVAKATTASSAAANRSFRAGEVGNLLTVTVGDIETAVMKEIRGTEGSIQAVAGLVATMDRNAGFFSTSTPSAQSSSEALANAGTQRSRGRQKSRKPVPPEAMEQIVIDGLALAFGQLRAATSDLDSRADRLTAIATPGSTQSAEALKLCKVENTLKPLTVTPSAVSFTAKKAGTQTVLIEGGNGNYTGAFLNGSATGLKAVPRPMSTGAIDIVADSTTVAGGYQLMIEDSTRGSRQIIAVTVAAAAAATDDAATQTSKVQDAIDAIKAEEDFEVNGVPVTLLDPVPRGKNGVLVKYRVEGDGSVTPEDVAQAVRNIPGVSDVLGSKPDTVEAQPADAAPNAGVQRRSGAPLTPAQVRSLQSALCMPENQRDGMWGPQTQAALVSDRARRRAAGAPNVSADKAELTTAETRLLLALTPEAVRARCKLP